MAQLPELAVRTVFTTNVALTGLPAANDGVTLAANEVALLTGQTAMAENGPWRVQSGPWSRHEEFDTSSEMVTGSKFYPLEGTNYGGSEWYLATTGTITLGTTALTFLQRAYPRTLSAGPRLEITNNQVRMAPVAGLTPGTYGIPNLTVTQEGTISFIESATIVIPTGMVAPYAGATEPSGWLFCDGRAVSRTTYAMLFALIGTTFGVGDGATSFNLPDLRGRVPVGVGQGDASGATLWDLAEKGGAETHALAVAEVPSHQHLVNRSQDGNFQGGGSKVGLTDLNTHPAGAGAFGTSNTGSGSAHNNMQPSLAFNFIIKT